jgi:ESCRT-II complex subunit VPS36
MLPCIRPGVLPAQMCDKLQELTGREGLGRPLTSSDVGAALGVPLAIASEHLLAAEALGVLCRDDGPEGLRFFRNFFADSNVAVAAQ